VEVVAKLPKGDWLWPAIWLLPEHQAYGQWPASGEIDLMESRGNAPGYPAGGVDCFGSTLHFGPFWPEDAYVSAQNINSAQAHSAQRGFALKRMQTLFVVVAACIVGRIRWTHSLSLAYFAWLGWLLGRLVWCNVGAWVRVAWRGVRCGAGVV
jgi:hypothetical protein